MQIMSRQQISKGESNMNIINEQLINRDEACLLLNVTSVTFWRYTKAKKFPYYRAGRKMLFKRSEILQAITVPAKKIDALNVKTKAYSHGILCYKNVCEHCGTAFKSIRNDAKCCSAKCRKQKFKLKAL